MNLLKSLESVPLFGGGVKWFDTKMHNSLFQHSVFGAIIFLVVSNTGVYKIVKDIICDVTGYKADGNTMQLIHAVVFAVIMYFGSLFILAPLLTEGVKNGKGGIHDITVGEQPKTRTTDQLSINFRHYFIGQTIGNMEAFEQICNNKGTIDMSMGIKQIWGLWRKNVLGRYKHRKMPKTKLDLMHAVFPGSDITDNEIGVDDVFVEGLQINMGGDTGGGGHSAGNDPANQVKMCSPIFTCLDLYLDQNITVTDAQKDVIESGLKGSLTEFGVQPTTKIDGVLFVFSHSRPSPFNNKTWKTLTEDYTPKEIITGFNILFFGKNGEYNQQGYTKDILDFLDVVTINLEGYRKNNVPINLYMCHYLADEKDTAIDTADGSLSS